MPLGEDKVGRTILPHSWVRLYHPSMSGISSHDKRRVNGAAGSVRTAMEAREWQQTQGNGGRHDGMAVDVQRHGNTQVLYVIM
jgi:hypothetical protein